jgi:predicted DNA-binding protein with PD1-like motif
VKVFSFDPGRTHIVSLREDDHLVESFTEFAEANGIFAATITFLGSVSKANLSWYDPDTGLYPTFLLDEQLEVAGFSGSACHG